VTKREDLQLKGRAAADRQDKGRKKCCEQGQPARIGGKATTPNVSFRWSFREPQ
jgi:hypothetical protein